MGSDGAASALRTASRPARPDPSSRVEGVRCAGAADHGIACRQHRGKASIAALGPATTLAFGPFSAASWTSAGSSGSNFSRQRAPRACCRPARLHQRAAQHHEAQCILQAHHAGQHGGDELATLCPTSATGQQTARHPGAGDGVFDAEGGGLRDDRRHQGLRIVARTMAARRHSASALPSAQRNRASRASRAAASCACSSRPCRRTESPAREHHHDSRRGRRQESAHATRRGFAQGDDRLRPSATTTMRCAKSRRPASSVSDVALRSASRPRLRTGALRAFDRRLQRPAVVINAADKRERCGPAERARAAAAAAQLEL